MANLANPATSGLYINPEGIEPATLSRIKDLFFSEEGADEWVFVEETSLPFRDLLYKIRQYATGVYGCSCFFILDKESAARLAVHFVEVSDSVGVKGMGERYPSAATTRRFFCAPETAVSHMASIFSACSDWVETWDQVKSAPQNTVYRY